MILEGWAGDLVTALDNYKYNKELGESAKTFGRRWIGQKGDFGPADFIQDIDALNISWTLRNDPNASVAECVQEIYSTSTGSFNDRYSRFLARRFGGQIASLRSAASSVFFMDVTIENTAFIAARYSILGNVKDANGEPRNTRISEFDEVDLAGLAEAFGDVLVTKL